MREEHREWVNKGNRGGVTDEVVVGAPMHWRGFAGAAREVGTWEREYEVCGGQCPLSIILCRLHIHPGPPPLLNKASTEERVVGVWVGREGRGGREVGGFTAVPFTPN